MTLKKIFVLIPVLLFGLTNTYAQNTPKPEAKKIRKAAKFRAGDFELKAGIGLMPTFVGDKARVLTPPVQASLGYRVNPNFTVSAFAGYSSVMGSVKEELNGSAYQSQNDFLVLGLRAEGHMTRIENVDIYGGLLLAYNRPFVTTTQLRAPQHPNNDDIPGANPTPYNPNPRNNNIIVGGTVGAAYYFTQNMNVFGEVGYGVSLVTAGLGYKF